MTEINDITEVWKPIPSWNNIYEASSNGRIRRVKPSTGTRAGYVLKPQSGRQCHGRLHVMLSINCRPRPHRVHKLVAEAFLGECPEGLEVNHIDGNHTNNRPNNLEYTTREYNMAHAVTNGLMARGEKSPNARLTVEQVLKVKAQRPRGKALRQFGASFGVSCQTIDDIVMGRTWKHLQWPPPSAD